MKLNIHPDAISYASIVAAALACAGFLRSGRTPWLLLAAPAFCYLRLWLNMLDGMVALASGKASPRGEILNDLPDRTSDLLVFAGIAHSGYAHPALAYWAAIGALLTAYVGTLGQAVAGRREFGGTMSKPWRMVVAHLAAWTTYILLRSRGSSAAFGLHAFDWASLAVVLGCAQTIWVRLASTLRLLASGKRT